MPDDMPTVVIPVITATKDIPIVWDTEMTHILGRQLVHNILVRKGGTYLNNKNGTRLKPIAQVIFSKGMRRLASNESPACIVSDLEVQLKLLRN